MKLQKNFEYLIIFRPVYEALNSFYSERSLLGHASLRKFVSNSFYPKGSLFRSFFFILKVIILSGLFSEQLLFQKVIILEGHYSKIWNIKTQPFGITTFQNNNLLE